MITVLIAEDHPDVRRALRTYLEGSGEITVIAEAEDGQQALDYLDHLQPDILLLDLAMPRKDGISVLRALHEKPTSPITIVVSQFEHDTVKSLALDAAAAAYVPKDKIFTELLPAIRAAVSA